MNQLIETPNYPVYYLSNKVKEDFEPYLSIIEDFLQSKTYAKKMKGHEHVLRLRAYKNKEDSATRLLFSYITVNNRRYMALLAVVHNHKDENYKTTVFNPSWLNEARKNIAEKIESDNQENRLKNPSEHEQTLFSATDLGFEAPKNESVVLKHIQNFNQIWITFNTIQEKILNTSLPNYFTGLPGGGKTSTALGLMKACYDNLPQGGRIGFITILSKLAKETKQNFLNNQHLKHDKTITEFWGLRNLIMYWEALHNRTCHFITQDLQNTWLKAFAKEIKNSAKVKNNIPKNKKKKTQQTPSWLDELIQEKKSVNTLINEIYVLAGCETPEEYVNGKGVQNTFLNDKKQRELLVSLHKSYCIYLEKNQLVDPMLYPFNQDFDYAFMVMPKDLDKQILSEAKTCLYVLTDEGFYFYDLGYRTTVPIVTLEAMGEKAWSMFSFYIKNELPHGKTLRREALNYLKSVTGHNPHALFDLIIFDECQNGSLYLFKQLAKLTVNKKSILVCGDDNQNTQHAVSMHAQAIQWLKKEHNNHHFEPINLQTSYRLPKKIAELASKILNAKISVAGRADKASCITVTVNSENQAGDLNWKTESDFVDMRDQQTTRVVTHPACLEEAKKKFYPLTVYLPEDVQGREFDTLIFWKIFDNSILEEAAKEPLFSIEAKKNPGRSDNHTLKHRFAPDFNTLFLLVTRAKKEIIVYQNEKKQFKELNTKFIQPLKKLFKINDKQHHLAPPPTQKINIEQLKEQLKEEEDLGNKRLIDDIKNTLAEEHIKEENLKKESSSPVSSTAHTGITENKEDSKGNEIPQKNPLKFFDKHIKQPVSEFIPLNGTSNWEEPNGILIKQDKEIKLFSKETIEKDFGIILTNRLWVPVNYGTNNTLKNLININKSNKKNNFCTKDLFYLENKGNDNWLAFAKNNIKKHANLGVSSGIIQEIPKVGCTNIIDIGGDKLCVNSKTYRNIYGFISHLPKKEELHKYYQLLDIDEKNVAVENVSALLLNINDSIKIPCFYAADNIKKNELVGYSFNIKFCWFNLQQIPKLFYKTGQEIPRSSYFIKEYDILIRLNENCFLPYTLTSDALREHINANNGLALNNKNKDPISLFSPTVARLVTLFNFIPQRDKSFKFYQYVLKKFELEKKAEFAIWDNRKRTEASVSERIFITVKEKNIDFLNQLFKTHIVEDINFRDSYGRTALSYVCENKDTDIITYLLARGAHPYISDNKGNTPYDYADENNQKNIDKVIFPTLNNILLPFPFLPGPGFEEWQQKHTQIQPLIEKFKIQGMTNTYLEQGLRRAVGFNCIKEVKIFLLYIKNINAQDDNDKSKKTALHVAACNGQIDMYNFLKNKGAEDTILDASNKTAKDYYETYCKISSNNLQF